jgi:hypothetical protein
MCLTPEQPPWVPEPKGSYNVYIENSMSPVMFLDPINRLYLYVLKYFNGGEILY